MAVFISVSTDPFEEVFAQAQSGRGATVASVRRPLRGIQIKEDTYGVLKALTSTGQELPLVDSGVSYNFSDADNTSSGGIANFIIQQITETRMEKQQIVETFGEDYIFFFGEKPRFLNVQGLLMNTADFNWKSEFWTNYDKYLRGTKLVENNARLYLYFDDIVVEGYLIQASTTQAATNPYHLPFNFQMFVSNYAILSAVGSSYFQQYAERADGGATAGNPLPKEGLLPDNTVVQGQVAANTVTQSAGGGLFSFLSSSSEYLQNATFSVQASLENVRNRLYGQSIIVPNGIGNQVNVPALSNNAKFQPAPTNRPIFEMYDEYVSGVDASSAPDARFDDAEIQRIRDIQKLNSPEELEKRARAILGVKGVDVNRRETNFLLNGKGAFTGLSGFGSFGIRRAEGALSNL